MKSVSEIPVAFRHLAFILLCMCASGVAPLHAQTTQDVGTTAQADDEATAVAAATDILHRLHRIGWPNNPGYDELFRELAAIGEPSQLEVFSELARTEFACDDLIAIVTEEWRKKALKVSPRHRAAALKIMGEKWIQGEDKRWVDVMELFGPIPELGPRAAKLSASIFLGTRKRAIPFLLKIDPTGQMAIDEIRETMRKNRDEYMPYCFDALRLLGKTGLPTLLELSTRTIVPVRLLAITAMKSSDGMFNQEAADRIVEIYLNPTNGMSVPARQARMDEIQLRKQCIETLSTMGEQGRRLASDLQLGVRPMSPARAKMMADLDAPAALKKILFPEDPSAAVSQAQYQVMQDLAQLDKKGARDSLERALAIVKESSDAGTQSIALRLAAHHADALIPDDADRLISAGKSVQPDACDQVASLLLGGRFDYTDAVRTLCFIWLLPKWHGSSLDMDRQNLAIKMLARYPLGRQGLVDSMGEDRELYSMSARAVQALLERHGLANVNGLWNTKAWISRSQRVAIGKLILDLDSDSAHADTTIVRGLFDKDPDRSKACATILTTETYFDKLGPATRSNAQSASLARVPAYGQQPLVSPLRQSPYRYEPPPSYASPPIAAVPFPENVSMRLLQLTACALIGGIVLLGMWVLVRSASYS